MLDVLKSSKKPIIGLLGGIGSGKSTVAAELSKLGCSIIDADKIAHGLLNRRGIKKQLVAVFNNTILDSSGKIERKKVANLAFADAKKLSSLNKIIHPLVLKRVEKLIEQYNRQTQVKAIVLDMPLLVEIGWAKRCDKLIFVDCDRKLRVDRAKKMGYNDNQIKIRENFQISVDSKAEIADNVVYNNSGFRALTRQVTDIFSQIVTNR